jgi:tetratricopeptide (TPR) repeat protein
VAFFGEEHSAEQDKAAQVQLLRAAKMDADAADPFALLGYWYEYKQDLKRAVGCYSKALLLDPSNPVAGRGILRLVPRDSLQRVLDNAIASASAVVGWAWRAVGLQKAFIEAHDELAVVSLLKALRCSDIERPGSESLAVFYSSPSHPILPGREELASVLADLASCYRRLGRFTAAIRCFHSSISESGVNVPSSVLCSCAQGTCGDAAWLTGSR